MTSEQDVQRAIEQGRLTKDGRRATRCGGVRLGVVGMDEQAHKFFLELLPNARGEFESLDPKWIEGEIHFGPRYHNDHTVWQTLCSIAGERDFYGDHPNDAKEWVMDALQACAHRDWWYQHEKEYGESIRESEGWPGQDQTDPPNDPSDPF